MAKTENLVSFSDEEMVVLRDVLYNLWVELTNFNHKKIIFNRHITEAYRHKHNHTITNIFQKINQYEVNELKDFDEGPKM